jgi:hypothetical protein
MVLTTAAQTKFVFLTAQPATLADLVMFARMVPTTAARTKFVFLTAQPVTIAHVLPATRKKALTASNYHIRFLVSCKTMERTNAPVGFKLPTLAKLPKPDQT